MSAAVVALRVEAKAREAMAEIYEEELNEEAAREARERARYLDMLAAELAQPPLISLVYAESDICDYAQETGVGQALALRRAREWGRHIQDTAASLCAEQLLSVVRGGQP
jgi:hypothetical protein